MGITYALCCADLFRLLSLFFFNPTEELARGLIERGVAEDVRVICGDLGITVPKAVLDQLGQPVAQPCAVGDILSTMRQEYTALFTHPKHPLISIYEMQFRDRRDARDTPSTLFLNEAALHAEQCYRKAGLRLSTECSREPGDHMGIELEFMAYLYTHIAGALEKGDEDDLKRWEEALVEFAPHLESWGIDFFDSCRRSGCGVIYPTIGAIGVVFLKQCLGDADSFAQEFLIVRQA